LHLDESEEDGYHRHAQLSKTNLKYFRLALLDNPKKTDKISKVAAPHSSPSRGRRAGE
jgi:hypothetical protein